MRAANGAEYSRYYKGGKAKAVHVHAEVFGLARVIANGSKVQSERRMHDAPHDETADNQQAKAIIVEGSRQKIDLVVLGEFQPKDLHPRHAHAAVAAGDVVKLEQERVEQHAEGEREHPEKNPDVAHAQQSNGQRNHGRYQNNDNEYKLE